MQSLDQRRYYQLTEAESAQIQSIFSASYCSDAERQNYIRSSFENGYLMGSAYCYLPQILRNRTGRELLYQYCLFNRRMDQICTYY